MSKELGYKIRRMRELRGFKQEIIADGLGIKQNTYSDIESGLSDISDERLDKIAEILGTTPDAIKAYDDRAIINIVNHHTGSGNAAGSSQVTIQTFDDLQKLVEVIVAPYKEQVAALKEVIDAQKEELRFYRNLVKKEK